MCIITIIIAHIIITRALSITKRAGCQRVYGESRRGTRQSAIKIQFNGTLLATWFERSCLHFSLSMDSMKLAFVADLSLLSSATSLRSLASHSAFKFAAVAPTPVQNTCSHGSADDEKMEGGDEVSAGG